MKNEFGKKITKEFLKLRAKSYSYLIDDGSEDKKAKGTKKCVIKRKLKFENYKNCVYYKCNLYCVNYMQLNLRIK